MAKPSPASEEGFDPAKADLADRVEAQLLLEELLEGLIRMRDEQKAKEAHGQDQ